MIIDPVSYLLDINWQKRFAVSFERGKYPSSSIINKSNLHNDDNLDDNVFVA